MPAILNRMRVGLILSLVVAGFVAFAAPADGETTVIVVRHAEKLVEPGNRDPALSEAGVERALALAAMLRDVPISAVYSSDYDRTRSTAEPVAEQAGVEVRLRDPRDPRGLRDEILREHPGGVVLVVGHSNTVPAVLGALGVDDPPALTESDYDNCFVVRASGEGATMLRLHFGAPTPVNP